MNRHSFLLAIILLGLSLPHVSEAQPTQVNYQGVLLRNGVPHSGVVDMKFVIVGGGASLWSLDGTSFAGSEPEAHVAVPVSEGVFEVVLGAPVAGQPGVMVPVTGDVLDGFKDAVLRVWVRNEEGAFELMSDQPFASSPFALVSEIAHKSLGDFEVGFDLNVGQNILGSGDLQISGTAQAGTFSGDGSGLTNVEAESLAPGPYGNAYDFSNPLNTFSGDGSGLTGVESSGLQGGSYGNPYSFTNPGNAFTGDGSGLSGVNAQSLTSGAHTGVYDFDNENNSFTGDGSRLSNVEAMALQEGEYSGALSFSNPANSFSGDGSGLTGVQAEALSSGAYGGAYDFSNPANVFTGNGSGLTNVTAEALAPGIYADTYVFSNPTNVFTGDGSGLTGVLTGDLATGTYSNAYHFDNPANVYIGDGSGLTNLQEWQLSGNTGTDPGLGNYLGTSDFAAFEIGVNGARALRFEPTTETPNLIGGASQNAVTPSIEGAVIGGGGDSTTGANTIDSNFGVVGGGLGNQITTAGPLSEFSTIGGGRFNMAHGLASTVPGGSDNVAGGDYSLAAGHMSEAMGDNSLALGTQAEAVDGGSLLLSDSSPVPFVSAAPNEFAVRATGGVRLVSSVDGVSGAPLSGVELAPGAGSWSSLSDAASKENVREMDGEAVLASLRNVPVSTWNYKTQDAGIRHAGPMAQDFKKSFLLGHDERRIGSLDIAGVNMAAIKALEARTRDLQRVDTELRLAHRELERMREAYLELQLRLSALESRLDTDRAALEEQ